MTYKSFSSKKEDILDYVFSDISFSKSFLNFETEKEYLMGSKQIQIVLTYMGSGYPCMLKLNNEIERNQFKFEKAESSSPELPKYIVELITFKNIIKKSKNDKP
ncbi:unnamed protein product, partial [Brachionus calyciflorus]